MDAEGLLIAVVGGVAVAAFFVGGLRLTIDRLSTARRPGLLVAGSFAGRAVVSIAALYLLANQRWQNLVASVAAFAIAHAYLTWRLGPASAPTQADRRLGTGSGTKREE